MKKTGKNTASAVETQGLIVSGGGNVLEVSPGRIH